MQPVSQNTTYFLHGLDSSGSGTKGQFFAKHYSWIHRPDFSQGLETRLAALTNLCKTQDNLTFIGSSYGGLMATRFAIDNPERISRLILLAPALNYENFSPPSTKLKITTIVLIGTQDDVTPPAKVLPLVEATFAHPEINLVEDDHFLHNTFSSLDWSSILNQG